MTRHALPTPKNVCVGGFFIIWSFIHISGWVGLESGAVSLQRRIKLTRQTYRFSVMSNNTTEILFLATHFFYAILRNSFLFSVEELLTRLFLCYYGLCGLTFRLIVSLSPYTHILVFLFMFAKKFILFALPSK